MSAFITFLKVRMISSIALVRVELPFNTNSNRVSSVRRVFQRSPASVVFSSAAVAAAVDIIADTISADGNPPLHMIGPNASIKSTNANALGVSRARVVSRSAFTITASCCAFICSVAAF